MKASATIYIPEGEDPFVSYTSRPSRAKVRLYIQKLQALIGGGIIARSLNGVATRPTVVAGTQYATAVVTLATVLAADTITLNGSALTAANGSPTAEQFDMSGTDAADATSLCAAINTTSAAALIAGLLRASNMAGSVVCASVAAGDTFAVAGVTFTAVGAASAKPDEFTMAGNDTADAAALVVAINAHPGTRDLVLASSATGTVTVRQLPFGQWTSTALRMTSSNATRLAVTQFAATAAVLIACASKGKEGNCMTIATSNAGRLAITSSLSRLGGGTSSTLTF